MLTNSFAVEISITYSFVKFVSEIFWLCAETHSGAQVPSKAQAHKPFDQEAVALYPAVTQVQWCFLIWGSKSLVIPLPSFGGQGQSCSRSLFPCELKRW